MSDGPLPEEVRELVTRHVRSVTQLEALLFFHERPQERWDAEALARRLYAGKSEVANALLSLCKDGFLKNENGLFAFAPRPELQADVNTLAAAYSRHLIAITDIIHSKPLCIQGSDAFKIRKN